MKDPLKPRDKFRQKMSRYGLIRENMTTGETENISAKTRENTQPDNVINENVTSEKIPKRKSSRLTFTEEERNIPELQRYIKKSDHAADRLDKARGKIPKKKTLSFDREFDEKSGKGKTRLHFEEKEKAETLFLLPLMKQALLCIKKFTRRSMITQALKQPTKPKKPQKHLEDSA